MDGASAASPWAGLKNDLPSEPVRRKAAYAFAASVMFPLRDNVTKILTRDILSLRGVGNKQPFVLEVIVGHTRPVVGDDDVVFPEVDIDSIGAGIEGVLYQFEYGDFVIRDQFPAQDRF
jgi:hypothetical protein